LTGFVLQLAQISQALTTPLIAAIVAYVAWQQLKTAERKLHADRYDRRFRVYQEVMTFVGLVMTNARVEVNDLYRLATSTADADFLFPSEIRRYIDEVHSRGVTLRRTNTEYRDYTQPHPPGYDHQRTVEEQHRELEWFTKQMTDAKERFRPYLDMSW
jgi:chlorite dismutase